MQARVGVGEGGEVTAPTDTPTLEQELAEIDAAFVHLDDLILTRRYISARWRLGQIRSRVAALAKRGDDAD